MSGSFKLLIWLYLVQVLFRIYACDTDMQKRYDVLNYFAIQYKRPFTTVDIAACGGECSLYLADRYKNAVCVLIEGNEAQNIAWADLIISRCRKMRISNIVLLGRAVYVNDIFRLGECEHFDLVFSFRAVERAGNLWRELIDALLGLGDHLILEIPDDQVEVQQYFIRKGASPIVSLSSTTIYYVPCHKTTLKRKTWLRTLESTLTINSTFEEKKLVKKTPYNSNLITSDWKAGINLITFKMYSGAYPELYKIKKALSELEYVWHNDWAMHNIIIQGDSLQLIDYSDPRMNGHYQAKSSAREKIYRKIAHCLELKEPKEVENFFWKYLKTKPTVHRFRNFIKKIFRKSE